MTLNRRLLVGILPILLIFLAVGLYAIFLFSKLGGAIDIILKENYQSVVASQNMKEACARMDTGLVLALGGDETQGKALVQKNDDIFRKNLDIEFHNITLPGEAGLAAKTSQLYGNYTAGIAKFFSLAASDPGRRLVYSNELMPVFSDIQTTAARILEINQQNMVEANNEARRQSRAAIHYMLGTLLAGFVIATSVTYALSRSITLPIQSLTDTAKQLGEGNLDQHVPVQSRDEVGLLADAFNKMAARLRAYRQSSTEKILQAQQTTESALRAFPDPILVFSTDREIQLQNAAADGFLQQIGGNLDSVGPLTA
jgi:NtrC-family two-component system sensor histidine kinase KinB